MDTNDFFKVALIVKQLPYSRQIRRDIAWDFADAFEREYKDRFPTTLFLDMSERSDEKSSK